MDHHAYVHGKEKMSDFVRDVEEFNQVFCPPTVSEPGFPDPEVLELRLNLMIEEFREVAGALYDRDLLNLSQELTDLIYVTIGMALACGIPLTEVWDEVHRANMAKQGGGKREDGKILKPEGWEPPNIESILGPQ